MSTTAFQKQYRDEFIYGFEDRQSILKSTCVQEAQIKGNECIFLVSDSGSAEAQTRGVDGLIAARGDNNTQLTCTLAEWHDLVRKTNFNVFASQGNQRNLMQQTTMAVVNRKMDDIIIAQLDTASNQANASAVQASQDLVVKCQVILGNAFVDITDEDNMFAVVTPAFNGYLLQIPEFSSADYVEVKPLTGPARRFRRWAGFNWLVHPRLTGSVGGGSGGTSEQCYFYHRNAIGCAADKDGMETPVGYNEEQGYSYARVSVHMGSKLLQQSGIVQALHDGSAYVAS